MAYYNPELTMLAARTEYFDRNGFKNGGYDDAWVSLKIGPIPFGFPNTKSRVRAVKPHDLHHVLTEYDTTWIGEAEIGAWEIASGCADYYAAWVLDMGGFAIGLIIAPVKVYRAFLRGRCTANLYKRTFDDELLARQVGDLRTELQLDRSTPPATLSNKISFLLWAVLSFGISTAPFMLGIAVIVLILLKVFGRI